MYRSIPNILTILRILLVPVFIWFFFFGESANSRMWAALIFIIAELTDYLDGSIARRYNLISNFGKVMDPLADKILTGAALIGIALPPLKLVSYAAVAVIFVREIAVSILRQEYARKKIYIPANQWGKLKTVTQMTGLTLTLVYLAFAQTENSTVNIIIYYYFWLVALITAFSGASYILPLILPSANKEEE
jgi:CDP-diacylglycerol--glycerol-3-phosphate 3-phosphatidyltransferase